MGAAARSAHEDSETMFSAGEGKRARAATLGRASDGHEACVRLP